MDIKQLIGETTYYDKKLALETKRPKSWCKSISAFANCFGGKLVFGVADDDELVGLANAEEDAEKLEKQLRKDELDLDDYLAQIRQVKKMGSLSSILKMLPGMNKIKDLNIDDKEFDKVEAIICSMTPQEKRNTKLLNGSRRMRIAKGSGTTVQDVNKFMKSFEMTQKMMKQMKSNKGGMKKMMKNIENMNPNDLKNFKF